MGCPGPHLGGSEASQPQPNGSQQQLWRRQGHQQQPQGVAELQDNPGRSAGVKPDKPLRLTADPAAPHRRRVPASSGAVTRPRASAAAPTAPSRTVGPSLSPQSLGGLGAAGCPMGISPQQVFRSHPNRSLCFSAAVSPSTCSEGVGRGRTRLGCGGDTWLPDTWDVAVEGHVSPCSPARIQGWGEQRRRKNAAKTPWGWMHWWDVWSL